MARTQVVLCLAGHIDHGKSSLVRALTGKVVDRLREEQRRGMTIELGFAHFDFEDFRFALIDVPGHERFVHTLLAGASGVDLALLVVAADDSVMPQTREHLSLLNLLGVRQGIVVVTKCDLVDRDQLDLVHLEVQELVEGSVLATAPVIEVSARTGQGLLELRRALVLVAGALSRRLRDDSRFRLPVDRVFSPAGQGTVITGTIWSGSAKVGDVLQLLPQNRPVRIRRIQSQGVDIDSVGGGERGAINLAAIKSSEIRRGHELVTPDAFVTGQRHLVQLHCLPDSAATVRNRMSVRIHLGADETTAQVLLGEGREIAPAVSGFAIVRTSRPIVVDYGQPFVIRQLSPSRTIGGGVIIAPALRSKDRLTRCLELAPGLLDPDPVERLSAFINLCGEVEFQTLTQAFIGLSWSQFALACETLLARNLVVRLNEPQPFYVSREYFEQVQAQLLKRCRAELERRRPERFLPVASLLSSIRHLGSTALLNAGLQEAILQGELLQTADQIGLRTRVKLSNRQRKLQEVLLSEYAAAGRMPPLLKEFATRNGCTLRDLEPLIDLAVESLQLDRLSDEQLIDHHALELLRQDLVTYFLDHAQITTSEIREHWGISRKHAVPVLEYFDRLLVTIRAGDVRVAGARLEVPL